MGFICLTKKSFVSTFIRNVRCSSSSPIYFLAGLTHQSIGVEYDEAVSLLKDISTKELEEWENNHFKELGQRVVFSTPELTVLDTNTGGLCKRSIHFNRNLDLEQSCVTLCSNHQEIDHSSLPPSLLQGLALSTTIYSVNKASNFVGQPTNEGNFPPKRIAVLGAGGCSLPGYLHSVLPSNVDCVELSADMRLAARECFGVKKLEKSCRFSLASGCGRDWLQKQVDTGRKIDVLIVDVEDGTCENEKKKKLVAPPQEFLSKNFLNCVEKSLAPGGVLAINTIADQDTFDNIVKKKIKSGLSGNFSHASCIALTSTGARQKITFSRLIDGVKSPLVNPIEHHHGLTLPKMVQNETEWLETWTAW